jgi:PadR family transcriptional regulator, regulatory protein AphA
MVSIELVRSGLYTPRVAVSTKRAVDLSTTEFAILGLLAAGEHSGYDLKKAAEAGIGYVWTAAKSQVYAVLPRLVAGGYATAKHVRQERLPDKQVYRITPRGEEAFLAWLEEPVDYYSPRSPFLLKVFFGSRMSRDALAAHVRRKREAAAEELAEYREIEKRIKDDERSYFGYATLRWGIAQARAWIRWADGLLEELAAR